MTRAILLVFVAFAAGASQAGWESWLKSDIYYARFWSYDKDEMLSDKGATNGTWSVADAEARAASDKGLSQYITFSTATGHTGIVFTPTTTGSRALKSVLVTAQLSAYEEDIPELSDDNPRGALAIHAPEGGGTNFIGWTDGKWVRLQAPSVEADPGTWYDISMKFVEVDGAVNVQYRVKKSKADSDYETLYAEDDPTVVMFKAGGGASDAIVSKIEFQGEGAFSYLSGSEPRRGLLIGLVPWREMLIDESVYHRGETGDWYVFDYDAKKSRDFPVVKGDAYDISVPEGENYTSFKPQELGSGNREVVEFTVNFTAPNDNDAAPTNDVCALVRLVEMPLTELTDVTKVDLDYRFACLANGGWYTNTNIRADVDADYTVEVTLDRDGQKVSYRIKQGRGAEAGTYQELWTDVPVSIGDPLFTFFGGVGKVYSIKATKPTDTME